MGENFCLLYGRLRGKVFGWGRKLCPSCFLGLSGGKGGKIKRRDKGKINAGVKKSGEISSADKNRARLRLVAAYFGLRPCLPAGRQAGFASDEPPGQKGRGLASFSQSQRRGASNAPPKAPLNTPKTEAKEGKRDVGATTGAGEELLKKW